MPHSAAGSGPGGGGVGAGRRPTARLVDKTERNWRRLILAFSGNGTRGTADRSGVEGSLDFGACGGCRLRGKPGPRRDHESHRFDKEWGVRLIRLRRTDRLKIIELVGGDFRPGMRRRNVRKKLSPSSTGYHADGPASNIRKALSSFDKEWGVRLKARLTENRRTLWRGLRPRDEEAEHSKN